MRLMNRKQAPTSEMPTQIWIPVRQEKQQRSWLLPLLLGAFLVLAVGAILAAGATALLFAASDYILPGVRVMDVSIGMMTPDEAAVALQNGWQAQTVALESDEARWPQAPDALGMTLDAAATAQTAYAQSRSLDGLRLMLANGWRVPPTWSFDPATAAATLQALAPELAVAPVNAGVRIANGQVEVTPPRDGRALDVPATLDTLAQNPARVLQDGYLPLLTQPVSPAISDVEAIAQKAEQLLTTAVAVRAFDPVSNETTTWTLDADVWGQWLSLAVDASAPDGFTWSLDTAAVESFLATQAQELGEDRYLETAEVATAVAQALGAQTPTVSARIYHRPRQHVVQSGESMSSIGYRYGIPYPWVQQANPGVESLAPGQVITIPSPDEMLPLPVVDNKRVVVSISAQRVWVYEDGQLKWEWPASTGIDSSPTSPGIFQIQTHEPNAYAANWDLWMPNFMGIYRPVPTSEFMNGFHGFPTRGGSTLLWTGDLGHKVTYGCILISSDNAQLLYDWAEAGVVVEIQP